MEELITSYLIQKKECDLPLLGHFRIKVKAAEHDKASQQIFPPAHEILYSEFAGRLSPDLLTYVSSLWHITPDEAETKINDWCLHAKDGLEKGTAIIFNPIGSLQKDGAGNIFFQGKKGIPFYETVAAQRVIHKNAEHSVLVGDNETTSVVMNEFYRDDSSAPKIWWARWNVWAYISLGICLFFLVFYFYTHKFSETGIGNQSSIKAEDPPVLHRSP